MSQCAWADGRKSRSNRSGVHTRMTYREEENRRRKNAELTKTLNEGDKLAPLAERVECGACRVQCGYRENVHLEAGAGKTSDDVWTSGGGTRQAEKW